MSSKTFFYFNFVLSFEIFCLVHAKSLITDTFDNNRPCETVFDCPSHLTCFASKCRCKFGSIQVPLKPKYDFEPRKLECFPYNCSDSQECRFHFGLDTHCDIPYSKCQCLPQMMVDNRTQACVMIRNEIYMENRNTSCQNDTDCTAQYGGGAFCSRDTSKCECLHDYWFNPFVGKCMAYVFDEKSANNFIIEAESDQNKGKHGFKFTLYYGLIIPACLLFIIFRVLRSIGRGTPSGAPPTSPATNHNNTRDIRNLSVISTNHNANSYQKRRFETDLPPSYQSALESSKQIELIPVSENQNDSDDFSKEIPPTLPPSYESLDNQKMV